MFVRHNWVKDGDTLQAHTLRTRTHMHSLTHTDSLTHMHAGKQWPLWLSISVVCCLVSCIIKIFTSNMSSARRLSHFLAARDLCVPVCVCVLCDKRATNRQQQQCKPLLFRLCLPAHSGGLKSKMRVISAQSACQANTQARWYKPTRTASH